MIRHRQRDMVAAVRGICVAAALLAAPVGSSLAGVPYELANDRDVALTGGAAALFAAGALLDTPHELTRAELAQLDAREIWKFDRSAVGRWSPAAARASDVLLWATTVAPLFLLADTPGRDRAATLALMYAETMALSNGATYLLKNITHRTRPFVYNEDPAIATELKLSRTAVRSFPSGHTSTSFASLVFLAAVHAHLHPDSSSRGWVWAGCLGTAATAGYLRYVSGRHFPTDILAGAVLGAAAGWLVPRWHERDLLRPPSAGTAPPLKLGLGFAF